MLPSIYAPVASQLEMVRRKLAASLTTDCISPAARLVFSYPLDSRGKQLRAALVLFGALVGKRDGHTDSPDCDRSRKAVRVGTAAELLHLATLLHDDVLDGAGERRGRPALGTLWGNKTSILTGDYFFARAYNLLVETGIPAFLSLFSEAVAQTCAGEVEEHLDSYNLDVNIERYLGRIGKKSASLFAACTRAGGLLAGGGRDIEAALGRYGYNLGVAFQLTDDLLDIIGEPSKLGKPVGQDLLQGVYTLPVLEALAEPKTGAKLRRMLGRDLDRAELEQVRSLVANSRGREKARQMALDYRDRAIGELHSLPPGPVRNSLVKVADFVVGRIF